MYIYISIFIELSLFVTLTLPIRCNKFSYPTQFTSDYFWNTVPCRNNHVKESLEIVFRNSPLKLFFKHFHWNITLKLSPVVLFWRNYHLNFIYNSPTDFWKKDNIPMLFWNSPLKINSEIFIQQSPKTIWKKKQCSSIHFEPVPELPSLKSLFWDSPSELEHIIKSSFPLMNCLPLILFRSSSMYHEHMSPHITFLCETFITQITRKRSFSGMRSHMST
jgi:hypothetical protein